MDTNSYASGSTFTLQPIFGQEPVRRLETAAGLQLKLSHEPAFHLAVAQFEDDGSPRRNSPTQAQGVLDAIMAGRQSSPDDGAIVVVFIHGWHHNAAWLRSPSRSVKDADGDAHFHSFRLVLESLAIREAERPHWRRVVGIYLSWNGDPVGGLRGALSRVIGLTATSFRNRYGAARKIGQSPSFQDLLRSIITATKAPLPPTRGRAPAAMPECPLIMMGHSMGALMLERGLLALLQDKQRSLIAQAQGAGTGAARVTSRLGPVSFPDLILALNSAADSSIASDIVTALASHGLAKTATGGGVEFSPPIIMSVTSTRDLATRVTWPLAQGVYAPFRRTDGHDRSLFTHDFVLTAANSTCKPRDFRDYGQNWHCLRKPVPSKSATPGIPVDLPTKERTNVNDRDIPYARYTITPTVNPNEPRLMWVFRVPPRVIPDHNTIFGPTARSLILALIQVSGAVASVAEDWGDSFEPECS